MSKRSVTYDAASPSRPIEASQKRGADNWERFVRSLSRFSMLHVSRLTDLDRDDWPAFFSLSAYPDNGRVISIVAADIEEALSELMQETAMKRCIRCRNDWPLTSFHRENLAPDGRFRICKACHSASRASNGEH